MMLPFSSKNKRSVVALDSPDRNGKVSVYLKGAPEEVLKKCHYFMGAGKRTAELDKTEQHNISEKINTMAAEPLRVIGLAYMEMDQMEWQSTFEQSGNNTAATF
jgi:magnesium-transporting ATPase (P-type)